METFQVILEGRCLEGFDPAEVRSALADLMGQTEAIAEQLLGAHEFIVKSRVDIVTSTRYVEALRSIGVASWVVPETLNLDVDLAVSLIDTNREFAVVGRKHSRVPDATRLATPDTQLQHGRSASTQTSVFGWFVLAGTAFALTVGGLAVLASSGRAGKDASMPASAPAPAQQIRGHEAPNR